MNELNDEEKQFIDEMQEVIDECEDEEEKKRREQLLLRFRMQIEKPYWSDNIYMELNIQNLE